MPTRPGTAICCAMPAEPVFKNGLSRLGIYGPCRPTLPPLPFTVPEVLLFLIQSSEGHHIPIIQIKYHKPNFFFNQNHINFINKKPRNSIWKLFTAISASLSQQIQWCKYANQSEQYWRSQQSSYAPNYHLIIERK